MADPRDLNLKYIEEVLKCNLNALSVTRVTRVSVHGKCRDTPLGIYRTSNHKYRAGDSESPWQ